jgi:WD40 repeat protein
MSHRHSSSLPYFRLRSGAHLSKSEAFGLAFSRYPLDGCAVFAAASGNQLTIFRCEKTGGLEPLIQYKDNALFGHVDPLVCEDFFAVSWAEDEGAGSRGSSAGSSRGTSPQLLCAGGRGSVITIVNASDGSLRGRLLGHGRDINHLSTHPSKPWLIVSASKDEACRLWNVTSSTCLAIYNGSNGHRFDVLCCAFSPSGAYFASGGMDNTVRVWATDDGAVTGAESAGSALGTAASKRSANFRKKDLPIVVSNPIFVTRAVHSDYVDGVAWVGGAVLSKCAGQRVAHKCVLWRPSLTPVASAITATTADLPGALSLEEASLSGLVDCSRWPLGLPPTLPPPGGHIGEVGASEDGEISALREFLVRGSDFWFSKIDVFIPKQGDTARAPLLAVPALGRICVFAIDQAGAASDAQQVPGGGISLTVPKISDEEACKHGIGADSFLMTAALGSVTNDDDKKYKRRAAEASDAKAAEESAEKAESSPEALPFVQANIVKPYQILSLQKISVGRGEKNDLGRAVAFSPDGDILVIVTQGGSVWRYDVN